MVSLATSQNGAQTWQSTPKHASPHASASLFEAFDNAAIANDRSMCRNPVAFFFFVEKLGIL
jgi:hypothetical protein